MDRPSILIVGAENAIRETMQRCIEQTGCHVVTSDPTLPEIRESLQSSPAVILLCEHDDEIVKQIGVRLNRGNGPVIVQAPQLESEGAGRNVEAIDLRLAEFAEGISVLANSTNESFLLSSVLTRNGLRLDRRSYEASVDGRNLKLTLTEFRILWQLLKGHGTVFSRKELCDECRESVATHACRSVDVHVRSLRVKLGDRAELIETVRGAGYRFRMKSSDEQRKPSAPRDHNARLSRKPVDSVSHHAIASTELD